MEALNRRFREWEHENQRYLIQLLEFAQAAALMVAQVAKSQVSLFVYISFKFIQGLLIAMNVILSDVKLIQHVGPNRAVKERHEFEIPELRRRYPLF